ncbi:S8 family serine peptidase [Mycoplasmopsis gallinacea]|uniref:S8 family serine peptidase n=1 Tax=Mycoplasmopsis gallinacea TaxID=29556 RepID=A0A6H0V340_9BACT|nr:S8 family serine peptidase [Mycoplasmopsis gallinacea]QIW61896.1 S8 family serine peptidase [Mycoplasmopsis gallinacea]
MKKKWKFGFLSSIFSLALAPIAISASPSPSIQVNEKEDSVAPFLNDLDSRDKILVLELKYEIPNFENFNQYSLFVKEKNNFYLKEIQKLNLSGISLEINPIFPEIWVNFSSEKEYQNIDFYYQKLKNLFFIKNTKVPYKNLLKKNWIPDYLFDTHIEWVKKYRTDNNYFSEQLKMVKDLEFPYFEENVYKMHKMEMEVDDFGFEFPYYRQKPKPKTIETKPADFKEKPNFKIGVLEVNNVFYRKDFSSDKTDEFKITTTNYFKPSEDSYFNKYIKTRNWFSDNEEKRQQFDFSENKNITHSANVTSIIKNTLSTYSNVELVYANFGGFVEDENSYFIRTLRGDNNITNKEWSFSGSSYKEWFKSMEYLLNNDVKIINHSYSSNRNSFDFYSGQEEFLDYIAYNFGVVNVFSSNNNASYESTIATGEFFDNNYKNSANSLFIGSINKNSVWSSFSGYKNNYKLPHQLAPIVLAPGENYNFSFLKNNSQKNGSGTSYSAPLVASLLGKLFSENSKLFNDKNISKLFSLIALSADKLNNLGFDKEGFGLFNFAKMYELSDKVIDLKNLERISNKNVTDKIFVGNDKKIRFSLAFLKTVGVNKNKFEYVYDWRKNYENEYLQYVNEFKIPRIYIEKLVNGKWIKIKDVNFAVSEYVKLDDISINENGYIRFVFENMDSQAKGSLVYESVDKGV